MLKYCFSHNGQMQALLDFNSRHHEVDFIIGENTRKSPYSDCRLTLPTKEELLSLSLSSTASCWWEAWVIFARLELIPLCAASARLLIARGGDYFFIWW